MKKFDGFVLLWLAYVVLSLGAFIGLIVTAIHFIVKYW